MESLCRVTGVHRRGVRLLEYAFPSSSTLRLWRSMVILVDRELTSSECIDADAPDQGSGFVTAAEPLYSLCVQYWPTAKQSPLRMSPLLTLAQY